MNKYATRLGGNPPVHPVAYHAGHTQESLRIGSILRDTFAEIGMAWRRYRKYREDRAAFQHLLSLDDSQLSDIGVTREQVETANSLPLSVNASAELEIVARSGNQTR